jgi:hypothetical protein
MKTRLEWILRKVKGMGATGKLDLNGEVLGDLKFLTSKSSLKHLDLSFTTLRSLAGLGHQPHLDNLMLDNSQLEHFANAKAIASISKLSVRNTPVAKISNYKLSILLVCGRNLRVINGVAVSDTLRQRCEAYPEVCARLVDQGWMAKYPCPAEEELRALCETYNIEYELQKKVSFGALQGFAAEEDIDTLLGRYRDEHEAMLTAATRKFEAAGSGGTRSELSIDPEAGSPSASEVYEPSDSLPSRFDTKWKEIPPEKLALSRRMANSRPKSQTAPESPRSLKQTPAAADQGEEEEEEEEEEQKESPQVAQDPKLSVRIRDVLHQFGFDAEMGNEGIMEALKRIVTSLHDAPSFPELRGNGDHGEDEVSEFTGIGSPE